ncbi:hypothetical protein WG66_002501 [Moniliophthora roreri]|nr:hypothetical protein WG66_002501 [Moniliophthora roreri]
MKACFHMFSILFRSSRPESSPRTHLSSKKDSCSQWQRSTKHRAARWKAGGKLRRWHLSTYSEVLVKLQGSARDNVRRVRSLLLEFCGSMDLVDDCSSKRSSASVHQSPLYMSTRILPNRKGRASPVSFIVPPSLSVDGFYYLALPGKPNSKYSENCKIVKFLGWFQLLIQLAVNPHRYRFS